MTNQKSWSLCKTADLLFQTMSLTRYSVLWAGLNITDIQPTVTECQKKDKNQIQRLQNSENRIIFNLRHFGHMSSFEGEIYVLPMDETCRIFSSFKIHKILTLNEPCYLSQRLSFWAEVFKRMAVMVEHFTFPYYKEFVRKLFLYWSKVVQQSLSQLAMNHMSINSSKPCPSNLGSNILLLIRV